MIAGHTHIHFVQGAEEPPEMLLLSLMIGTDGTIDEVEFENSYFVEFEQHEAARFDEIRSGAREALEAAGVNGATVNIIDISFMDAYTPNRLFRQVARICVENALRDPTGTFSYNGKRRQIERWMQTHERRRNMYVGSRRQAGCPSSGSISE